MRGDEIEKAIVELLEKEGRPMSTLEISKIISVSWHPVTVHCLKLQMNGRIKGCHIGRMNVWEIKGIV